MKKVNIVICVVALFSELLNQGNRNVLYKQVDINVVVSEIKNSVMTHRSTSGFTQINSQPLIWDDSLVYSVSRSDLEMHVTIYTREIGNAFDYLVVIDYLWLTHPNSDRDLFYIGYDQSVLNAVGFSFVQRQCVSRFIGHDSLHSTKCTQSDRLENASMGLLGWGIDYGDRSNLLIYSNTVHWGLASFILRAPNRIDDGTVLFAFQFIDNVQLKPQDSVVCEVEEFDEQQILIAKVIPSDRQRYLSGFYE